MKLVLDDKNPSIVFCLFNNEFERQELKNWMTIKIPGAKYSTKVRNKQWDGKKCFFNRFTNSFPIGFLDRVLKKWQDATLQDMRTYKDIKFKIPVLRDPSDPSKLLEWRMYQKEALLCAYEYKNCMIQAATNAGKSAVIAALAVLLREESVMIVVHRVELLWQLRKMIMVYTAGMEVGYVTSDEVNVDPHVNIVMVMTLLKRIDTDPYIQDMFNKSKVLICDEVHHMKAATHAEVFKRSKAVYRFGCSGTIPEEDTYDGWLARQYIGDVVFNVTNKELIDQGISADPLIKMVEFWHDIDYIEIVNQIRAEDAMKGKTYPTAWKEREEVYKRVFAVVLKEHIVQNDIRNKAVVEKICKDYRGKQTLIVVDFLEHGKRIHDLMWEQEKDNVDFIHGQSESRKGSLLAFRRGEMRVLISTSIVDEGIDISRIEVLVLAGGKKSKRQILQRIGRGLRRKEGENKVIVLDFYDYDGKYLEKHSAERLKIYNKEGFNVEIIKDKVVDKTG